MKKQGPSAGKKRWIGIAACGVMAAGLSIGAFLLFGERAPTSPLLSTGLQSYADRAYLACSAPAGQSISLSAEWLDHTLQGSAVSAITVTALPPVTEGRLLLGHSEVQLGQTVSRETLSYLTFVPNEGVRESSFSFVPTTAAGTCGYSLRCALSLTDTVNCCPVSSGSVTAVSTHTSILLTGTLIAKDPEGEALRFEILQYPTNGTLALDAETGGFTYTPNADFVGEDSFTWRAQDTRGAFCEPATTSITVRALTTGYLFADVVDCNLQSAAQRMTETGLMGGEATGGKHYFHPDRALTRAAFVAILLKAADVDFPEATETGFGDDAEIPAGMKGAIRYAREQGWLGNDERFRPHEPITRAEAAKIAAAVLQLSAPGYHETVEDFEAIPVDAADALYAIYEGGYITTLANGTIAPLGELTRGDAAKFFARLLGERSA